jgi:signal transduction histidine kinase
MNKLESLFASIFGIKEHEDTDRYFLSMICFTASVFSAILSIMHIIMNLKNEPIFIAASSSLVLLGFYFLIRFGKYLFVPKLIFTIFGLVALDFTWYSKFLSLGPVLFFIFAFGALIIWIWEGKSLFLMLSFYFVNTLVLFAIEYTSTEFEFSYVNLKTRSIDIYLSFILYSSLMIFILSRIKKDFLKQKKRAIESDNLKSAFLANVSHEIRTPMNAIIGFSDLLENETDPDKRDNYIKMIQNSSSGLLELINELIDLSKIEAGDVQLSYSNFSIEELFIELTSIFTLELENKEKKSVKIEYNLLNGDFLIYSDHYRLKQILSNLINNAVKFTSKGVIKFDCINKGSELLFSVSDTGTGIKEEDQLKIFDRFAKFNYQGMNTEGSGIGLSIVEKIVKLFNGQIWFESEWEKGTIFYFKIPVYKNQMSKEIIENKVDVEKIKLRNGVLVVEDDKNSGILMNEILKSLDIKAINVENGLEAIEYVKKNSEIQIVLMDLQLPEMNGYDATKEIKKINPHIKVIAQTAYAVVGDREKAIEAGCDDYITKPIDAKKLKDLISKYRD